MQTGDLFADQPQAVDHDCLGCGRHHHGAREVTLASGAVVSSYSEAWRVECEARSILRLPTLEKRQQRLANIERFRGQPAADELRDAMLVVWNAGQAGKIAARAAG